MAFCSYCGTQLPDGVRFCKICGQALAQVQQQAQPGAPPASPQYSNAPPASPQYSNAPPASPQYSNAPPAPPQYGSAAPSPKSKSKATFIIAGISVFVVALVAVILFTNGFGLLNKTVGDNIKNIADDTKQETTGSRPENGATVTPSQSVQTPTPEPASTVMPSDTPSPTPSPSQTSPKPTPEPTPEPSPPQDNNEWAAAYLGVVNDLIGRYGEGAIDIIDEWGSLLMTGAFMIRLIDFDGDGTPELYCAFLDAPRPLDYPIRFRQVVYGYDNGLKVLMEERQVSNPGTDVSPSVTFMYKYGKVFIIDINEICYGSYYALENGKMVSVLDYVYDFWEEKNHSVNGIPVTGDDLWYAINEMEVAADIECIDFFALDADEFETILAETYATQALLGAPVSVFTEAQARDALISACAVKWSSIGVTEAMLNDTSQADITLLRVSKIRYQGSNVYCFEVFIYRITADCAYVFADGSVVFDGDPDFDSYGYLFG